MASKKWLSLAAAAVLTAGVFTGCGDDDDDPAASSTTTGITVEASDPTLYGGSYNGATAIDQNSSSTTVQVLTSGVTQMSFSLGYHRQGNTYTEWNGTMANLYNVDANLTENISITPVTTLVAASYEQDSDIQTAYKKAFSMLGLDPEGNTSVNLTTMISVLNKPTTDLYSGSVSTPTGTVGIPVAAKAGIAALGAQLNLIGQATGSAPSVAAVRSLFAEKLAVASTTAPATADLNSSTVAQAGLTSTTVQSALGLSSTQATNVNTASFNLGAAFAVEVANGTDPLAAADGIVNAVADNTLSALTNVSTAQTAVNSGVTKALQNSIGAVLQIQGDANTSENIGRIIPVSTTPSSSVGSVISFNSGTASDWNGTAYPQYAVELRDFNMSTNSITPTSADVGFSFQNQGNTNISYQMIVADLNVSYSSSNSATGFNIQDPTSNLSVWISGTASDGTSQSTSFTDYYYGYIANALAQDSNYTAFDINQTVYLLENNLTNLYSGFSTMTGANTNWSLTYVVNLKDANGNNIQFLREVDNTNEANITTHATGSVVSGSKSISGGLMFGGSFTE